MKKYSTALIFSGFLVIIQILLSQQLFFQKPENLAALGFTFYKPLNILFYNFVHSGYVHLIMNISLIAAAGSIVEEKIGLKKTAVLFFAGSAVSAVLFILLNPDYAVIGSSAGGIALFAAALSVETKKTIYRIAMGFAAALVIISIINFSVNSEVTKANEELRDLYKEAQSARERNDVAVVQKTNYEITAKEKTIKEIEKGIDIQTRLPAAFEIHIFAAIFGTFFIYFFSRKELMKNVRETKKGISSAAKRFRLG